MMLEYMASRSPLILMLTFPIAQPKPIRVSDRQFNQSTAMFTAHQILDSDKEKDIRVKPYTSRIVRIE